MAVAVNRIYYGMYYIVSALALKYHFKTSKHHQLIGWFNKEFIAKGIIDPVLGQILRNSFQSRTKGDYDAFITFEKEEVKSMLKDMEYFIESLEDFINNH